jgi:uncharacterized protein (TIGR00730 family)
MPFFVNNEINVTNMNHMRVSVFCSSSSLASRRFIDESIELANNLVKENYLVQYGGGAVGLMGHLSKTVLSLKGEIRGFIPQFMIDEGWNNEDVKDMIVVKDMQDRKRKIMMETDAIVALAGGYGTLEELTEAITLKQLGLIAIPIIIVNTDGFYNPLVQMFQQMKKENFIRDAHCDIWQAVDTAKEVVPLLNNTPAWDVEDARNSAAI